MSRIPTVFFVSVYGLTALASLMLASAEGAGFPALLTVPIAILAYLFTEKWKLFGLGDVWANLLGLAAFVLAGVNAWHSNMEGRLLAGSHLMVYLTWIVLLQNKRLGQYWWMCALSVLQVAVGSILTNSGSYGALLILFMFLAICTLAVFSFYQARLQHGELALPHGAEEAASRSEKWPQHERRRRDRSLSNLGAILLAPGSSRSAIQFDPDERWMGLRFGISMAAICVASLFTAAAFFLLIPRLWAGRSEWGSAQSAGASTMIGMSGFTAEVRLGEMVPLLENAKRVLQVTLYDDHTSERIDLERYCAAAGFPEPLFRGASMETYSEGLWQGYGRQPPTYDFQMTPRGDLALVRQQFVMEPIGTPLLFAIGTAICIRMPNAGEPAEQNPITHDIFRSPNTSSDRPISYEVFGFQAGEVAQRSGRSVFDAHDALESSFFERYRTPPQLPRLIEHARKIAGYAPPPPGERETARRQRQMAMVDRLLFELRDSGKYGYSLEGGVVDPNLDPIEDFLFNRKAGHCEYFASALVLMLRACDIPARLVSGFKGGSLNSLTGAYEVEQRHAHAWAEAYIGGSVRFGRLERRIGRWRTFDPTPAARDASVASFASQSRARAFASMVDSTWNRYVVNIDINAQQSSFYVPFIASVREWWSPASGERPLLARIVNRVIEIIRDPTQWLTGEGLMIASLAFATITGLLIAFRMRRRIFAALKRRLRMQTGEERIRVAFYERFERIFAMLACFRRPGQTQLEFAADVQGKLFELHNRGTPFNTLPPRLVDFFYRVRFGDQRLEEAEIETLDAELGELERTLRSGAAREHRKS